MIVTRIVRVYLFILGVYHITTGILSLCFTSFAIPFNSFLYDFHLRMDDQLFLVSKPWGALAIFTGIVTLCAYKNPRQYRGVIYALIILLLSRATYRLIYAQKINQVLQTHFYRNFINIALLLGGALLLFSWTVRNRKENDVKEI